MSVLIWIAGGLVAAVALLFASPTMRRYAKMKKM